MMMIKMAMIVRQGIFLNFAWVTIGAKHRVYGKIVKDVWETFVSNGSVSPRKRISGKFSKLGLGELQLAEAMKTKKLSITYKHIRSNLLLHFSGETSVSAVGRTCIVVLCVRVIGHGNG